MPVLAAADEKTLSGVGILQLELQIVGEPVEVREMERGRFEVFRLAGRTFGVATYEPGWRWSTDVGHDPAARCQVEHVGFVISGSAAVLMDDGTELIMRAGDFFAIPPGHDSWVVGDERYVSLHMLGAESYTRE
jgi:mannose-6-phosphate isomerase-like protein (cupin superfamily)